MINPVILFGIIAGVLQILGYVLYTKEVMKSRIKPNTASWGIWAYGNVLITISYISVAQDLYKEILPIVCTLSCIVVFGIFLKKGKFQKIDLVEKWVFGFDVALTFLWWLIAEIGIFDKNELNILVHSLLILSTVVSFIPIIREVKMHPSIEKPMPWMVWALAYGFLCVAVFLSWSGLGSFLYPITYFILHAIVAFMCEDFQYHKKIFKPRKKN